MSLLLGLTLSSCHKSGSKAGGKGLEIGRVERANLLQRVTIAGNISPVRTTKITAPYSGYVKKLFVKVGDTIKVGAPIVSVAQSLLSAQPVFPMLSPLSGIVVQINKSEGEFTREGDNNDFILRIDDTSQFLVKAITPEIDRIKVKVGQRAVIKVNAIFNKTFDGVIQSIAMAPNNKDSWQSSTVEYATVIELTNPDEQIQSGMSCLVDLIVDKREKVLTLRHEFIQRDSKGYFVTRENGERQSIQVGLQNEEVFEILSGLNEGDPVRMVDFSKASETRP